MISNVGEWFERTRIGMFLAAPYKLHKLREAHDELRTRVWEQEQEILKLELHATGEELLTEGEILIIRTKHRIAETELKLRQSMVEQIYSDGTGKFEHNMFRPLNIVKRTNNGK